MFYLYKTNAGNVIMKNRAARRFYVVRGEDKELLVQDEITDLDLCRLVAEKLLIPSECVQGDELNTAYEQALRLIEDPSILPQKRDKKYKKPFTARQRS